MSHTVTKKEKGLIDISISLPASDIDASWESVLARLGKSIDVPGFRPGSAPSNIVLERVGTGRVYNEIASDLLTRELGKILKAEDLTPIDNPQIKIDQIEKGKEFKATVTFSQKPNVTVADWRSIKVKKVAIKEASEADVEQSIKNIFEAWKKRKADQKTQADQTKSEDDKGKFIYDASGNKIFVEEKKESEDVINDEFAKQIGANDLSHLKELVKTDLITASERAAEREFENQLFDKLIEKTRVEIPEVLVEDEINRMLVSLSQEVQSVGMNLEDYLKREGKNIEDLKTSWRAQAEKNVTLQLSLDEIAHGLGITITEEELTRALAETDQSKMDDEQKASLVRYMTFALIQSKTLAAIKESALGDKTEKPEAKKEVKDA